MRTKRISNGKEYFYEMKAVWLSIPVHTELREYSDKHGLSLSKAINKLLQEKQ